MAFTSPSLAPVAPSSHSSSLTFHNRHHARCRRRPRPRVRSSAATPEHPHSESESSAFFERMIVLPASVTHGNDVLLPGCTQVLRIESARTQSALRTLNVSPSGSSVSSDALVAHVPVDAWGQRARVGTVARIDSISPVSLSPPSPSSSSSSSSFPSESVLIVCCSGLCRFRVQTFIEEGLYASVRIFYDTPVSDGKGGETGASLSRLRMLDAQLQSAVMDVVRLSVKVHPGRAERLKDTLRHLEAYCAEGGGAGRNGLDSVLGEWVFHLDEHRRRELLSFMAVDLLSLSFMARRGMLIETDTAARIEFALDALQPILKELAAKGAIVSALGQDGTGTPPSPPSPASPTPGV